MTLDPMQLVADRVRARYEYLGAVGDDLDEPQLDLLQDEARFLAILVQAMRDERDRDAAEADQLRQKVHKMMRLAESAQARAADG